MIGGSYTGMYALLVAEQDESIGLPSRVFWPRRAGHGGGDKILCVIAGKLRAFCVCLMSRL